MLRHRSLRSDTSGGSDASLRETTTGRPTSLPWALVSAILTPRTLAVRRSPSGCIAVQLYDTAHGPCCSEHWLAGRDGRSRGAAISLPEELDSGTRIQSVKASSEVIERNAYGAQGALAVVLLEERATRTSGRGAPGDSPIGLCRRGRATVRSPTSNQIQTWLWPHAHSNSHVSGIRYRRLDVDNSSRRGSRTHDRV
jgi:hypothetical protein